MGEYDLPFVDEYNPISSKPVPPNVFSLREISPSEIKLTWASNPKPVIGYIVQKIVPYAPGYIFLDTLSAETLCFTDSLEITCDSIYAYQVYAYNDVGTSSPYLAKIRTRKCITSIPGEKDIWPVKIYPNPAHDRIFVILEGISDLTNIVLVITDINGRFIFNQNITKYQSEIDMSDFSKGNYMISVLKKNVSICTTKIMLK